MSERRKTFQIGSSRPAGSGLLDELIGAVPPQPSAPAPVAAGNKFVSELGPDSPLEAIEDRIRTSTNEYVAEVGRLLGYVRDRELWRKAATPYNSWDEYLRLRWDWTRQYANLLIRMVPVIEACSPHSDRPINGGQGKALLRVVERHGIDAAVEVFKATPGRRSAAALEKTAVRLGYLEPEEKPKPAEPSFAELWARFEPVLPVVRDLPALADLAKAAPERGMELAWEFSRAVQEIKEDLPEELRERLERAVLEGKPPLEE